MKAFNLEEYLKNPKRKVVTKDGRNVRIVCTDFKSELYPVLALVDNWGEEICNSYTKEGRFLPNNEHPRDLFFAPEKKEGWINIWDGDDGTRCVGAEIFDSYEDAKNRDIIDRIATIKIEWKE